MSAAIDSSGLKPAFADPVLGAQAAFRTILDAMAYAGRVQRLANGLDAPAPFCAATTAAALTLMDFETPVWLDDACRHGESADYLRFHAGTPLVADARAARFAVIADPQAMPPLAAFDPGEDRYPDRSCTLVIQVVSLTEGRVRRWTGPGIDGVLERAIGGMADRFWDEWRLNSELYPTGLDIIFTCGDALVGMPRGIKVEG